MNYVKSRRGNITAHCTQRCIIIFPSSRAIIALNADIEKRDTATRRSSRLHPTYVAERVANCASVYPDFLALEPLSDVCD
jgi:hypothetical protein